MLIERSHGYHADAHYVGFFECFNGQLFFEAHEVLEELWLADRHGRNGAFYKGLIQLAGAFVHLQKKRPGPARALLRLAAANLEPYSPHHEHLDVSQVLRMIGDWMGRLTGDAGGSIELFQEHFPTVTLDESAFVRA